MQATSHLPIIVDVHPEPESALCDGPQALVGSDLSKLAAAVRRIPPLLGRVDAGDRVRTTRPVRTVDQQPRESPTLAR